MYTLDYRRTHYIPTNIIVHYITTNIIVHYITTNITTHYINTNIITHYIVIITMRRQHSQEFGGAVSPVLHNKLECSTTVAVLQECGNNKL